MKKKEKLSIFVYTVCGVLVGTIIGGAVMMKLTGKRQDDRKAEAADAVRAELPFETPPVQTFAVTTMTFTATTTTTTTTFTTMTTTTTAPPPPPLEPHEISDILIPAKDALSMKYHYSDSDQYEYYSEWGSFRVPFTTESARFTYDGVIVAGIDPSKIEIAADNLLNLITVKLPEPEIISNDLDEDSIRYYDVHSPLFGSSDMNHYRSMIRDLKKKQADKTMNDSSFIAELNANAETVIRNVLKQSEKTAKFNVTFGDIPKQDGISIEFLPAGQNALTVPTEPTVPDEQQYEPENEAGEQDVSAADEPEDAVGGYGDSEDYAEEEQGAGEWDAELADDFFY